MIDPAILNLHHVPDSSQPDSHIWKKCCSLFLQFMQYTSAERSNVWFQLKLHLERGSTAAVQPFNITVNHNVCSAQYHHHHHHHWDQDEGKVVTPARRYGSWVEANQLQSGFAARRTFVISIIVLSNVTIIILCSYTITIKALMTTQSIPWEIINKFDKNHHNSGAPEITIWSI